MRQVTRRTVLAGATASAATVLAPISGIDRVLAKADCLRTLAAFKKEAAKQRLTGVQRKLIVQQGFKLIDAFYCHLPQKEKLGARPLQHLKELEKVAERLDDPAFHARMFAIFTELRDQHTRYRPPAPYHDAVAFLPFRIETCSENGRRKHIMSRIIPGFKHSTFVPGVEILQWNGRPIERAAEREAGDGATPSARQCIGVARLTQRVLFLHPIPEEESVKIRYRADDGKERDIEFDWQVVSLPRDACLANCGEMEQMQEARKFLFSKIDECSEPIESKLHKTPAGDEFGYIRVYSFGTAVLSQDDWVKKFREHVAKFTKTKGLIVDVRDNPGGSIRVSERILQWVAPAGPITPSTLFFRATDTVLRFCELPTAVDDLGPDGLRPWIPSIRQALKTGKTFSDDFEYTDKKLCNVGDRVVFPRPVIVVTSGMTWSAAEFFAAGFQDHGGTILGVDETTGGGGANFRRLSQLSGLFAKDMQKSPFDDLAGKANEAGFQVSFRRNKRVGRGAGKEIEDAGVTRNEAHAMTRNDVLHDNQDLKNHAARLLAKMK